MSSLTKHSTEKAIAILLKKNIFKISLYKIKCVYTEFPKFAAVGQ